MYVFMSVCLYVCMYVCMYMTVHMYVHLYVYVCTYERLDGWIDVKDACVHTCYARSKL